MSFRRVLPLLLLLFVAPLRAQNVDERILSFHSHIQLEREGSMRVTETIRVRALGQQIKRGIFRDFPTDYHDRWGNRVVVGFAVLEVTRNGNTEPFRLENIGEGKRVRIGQADVLLPRGEHTYEIRYRTDRQLGFFEKHDELYWNVTGNGWDFVIERASVEVHMPPDGPRLETAEGYTGVRGSRERALKAEVTFEGVATYETTRPLGPGEGLTIVATFPKGYYAPPTTEQHVRYFFADNRSMLAGLAGFAALLFYYALAWMLVGRDPPRGMVTPRFTPPDDLSPAAMRYLLRMGYDDKTFAAAVVSMAVKGRLRIEERDDGYLLTRTTLKYEPDDDRFRTPRETMAPEERDAFQRLLGGRSDLELKNTNHQVISSAVDALKKSLAARMEKKYFLRNSRYLVPGVGLTLLFVLAMVLSETGERMMVAGFMSVWLTGWSFGVFFLVRQAMQAWKAALFGYGAKARLLAGGGAVFMTLFALPFVAGEIFGLVMLASVTSLAAVALLFGMALVNYIFYHLMKAPTLVGRELLDQVEGFRMFLVQSEAGREQALAPERTAQTFQKYLPYAMALDLEDEWGRQFATAAAAAVGGRPLEDETQVIPWYFGRRTFAPTALASALGSSFSSALSSAGTAPGSSSGSSSGGGGGSSGGGGGGGGGGGW
jgi:uncharacterized membrane protein YgcG